MGSEAITAGSSDTNALTSTIVPLNGQSMLEAALTDFTRAASSPFLNLLADVWQLYEDDITQQRLGTVGNTYRGHITFNGNPLVIGNVMQGHGSLVGPC